MDIILPVIIFFFIFVIVSLCGYCCKRKREGVVYRYGFNGATASPVVVPPYPVEPRHPTPQVGPPAPAPGFLPPADQQTHMMYPPAAMPYPGVPPLPEIVPYASVVPYPTHSGAIPTYTANPPSYSEAVSQPPIHPPIAKELYSKQAPYNPEFKHV